MPLMIVEYARTMILLAQVLMIQAIISDFQSIINAKLQVEGVTLIIGESNEGKSACLRALQAACTNRFKAGQVRFDQDHATIRIKVPESPDILTVQRSWNGGSPLIKLGSRTFSKLGRTLPKEVAQYLNLGYLECSGEQYSCNFHPQFQKPLLLEFSQQKVMEMLSASSALDDLKELKECVMVDRASNKGAISGVESIISNTRESISHANDVLEVFQPLAADFDIKVDSYEVNESILQHIDEFISLLSSVELILKKEQLLQQLSTTVTAILELSQQLDDLEALVSATGLYCNTATHENTLFLAVPVCQSLSLVSSQIDDCVYLQEVLGSLESKSEAQSSLESTLTVLSKGITLEDNVLETNNNLYHLQDLFTNLSILTSFTARECELLKVVEEHLCPVCGNKVEDKIHN